MLVDFYNQPVGVLVDSVNAFVLRKVGDDWVWLFAPPAGFPEQEIIFYHQSPRCDDARLFLNAPTQGLAFPGQVHSGTLFYTKVVDPSLSNIAVTLRGQERFPANIVATSPTTCELVNYTRSIGRRRPGG